MTDITVSRELLRQVAEWSHLSNGPEQLYHLQKALRAALEQSVVKPDNLQCKSVQEPVHKLIYPGGGKALFNRLWHLTCNAVATQSGMRVRTDVMPMREMKEFLDHLCVLVDSPPQPVPAPVQEPSHDVVAGAIFDFAGFLTSHKVMIEVGSCSNASPMVERIKEWSGNRGLSLENPDVFGWQMRTAQPRKAVKLTNIHKAVIGHDHFGNPIPKEWCAAAEQLESAVLKANGVTE